MERSFRMRLSFCFPLLGSTKKKSAPEILSSRASRLAQISTSSVESPEDACHKGATSVLPERNPSLHKHCIKPLGIRNPAQKRKRGIHRKTNPNNPPRKTSAHISQRIAHSLANPSSVAMLPTSSQAYNRHIIIVRDGECFLRWAFRGESQTNQHSHHAK